MRGSGFPCETRSSPLSLAGRIQGSAATTLGIALGDVGTWLFTFWLCVDLFFNLDVWKEGLVKAIYKTGLETLAVLWGLQG
jgi:hypothetical protein